MTRWWFAVVVLFAAQACSSASGQGNRTGRQVPAILVESAGVTRMSVQRSVDLAGTLISPDQAKVSSEVAGVVREVLVQLGQHVERGQVLVRLDPRELELALERAQSALKQTEAQLGIRDESGVPLPDNELAAIRTAIANRDDAHAQNERAEELGRRGLIANVDLEATRTKVKVADAAYQSAVETVSALKASLQDRRAAYLLAQKKLSDATIKAPVPGSVSERLVQPGECIKEDTPVITLVQMDPLKLTTGIQERYAGEIHPDMSVQFGVESFPGEIFHGRIASISPAVDQQTRTFVVEAELPNPDYRLRPGFFAKGVILTRIDDSVLAVPDKAVSTLAGVSTAYIIDSGKIRPQQVSLGVRQKGLVEITEGLTGSERVATTNLNQLAAGVPVVESKGDAANPDPSPGRGRSRRQS